MAEDKRLLIEQLADCAAYNRFSVEEFRRLISLCLQLEKNCPGVSFVVTAGSAACVERDLLRQAQGLMRSDRPVIELSRSHRPALA